MIRSERRYVLEMSRFSDEELVVLARECGFLPARQELLLRYFDPMKKWIAAHAREAGLGAADIEDAQGDGVLASLEAVAKYDTWQLARNQGRSFRSFLYAVLLVRFRDFLRRLWRTRRRYGSTLNEPESLESAAEHDSDRPTRGAVPLAANADPAQLTECREQMTCLCSALGMLDNRSRCLWERLAAGASLHAIAEDWGVSYHRVRRWRTRLLADLRACLHGSGKNAALRRRFRARTAKE
jgi:RNA polymerase sigma factor (sigma-70 family)